MHEFERPTFLNWYGNSLPVRNWWPTLCWFGLWPGFDLKFDPIVCFIINAIFQKLFEHAGLHNFLIEALLWTRFWVQEGLFVKSFVFYSSFCHHTPKKPNWSLEEINLTILHMHWYLYYDINNMLIFIIFIYILYTCTVTACLYHWWFKLATI